MSKSLMMYDETLEESLRSRINLLEAEILILKDQIVAMSVALGTDIAAISDRLAESESTIVNVYWKKEGE